MLDILLSILAPVFDLVGLAGERTRRGRILRETLKPIENRLRTVLATVPLSLPEGERARLKDEVDRLNQLFADSKKKGKAPAQTEFENLIRDLRLFTEQAPTYSNTFTVLSHARKVSESLV